MENLSETTTVERHYVTSWRSSAHLVLLCVLAALAHGGQALAAERDSLRSLKSIAVRVAVSDPSAVAGGLSQESILFGVSRALSGGNIRIVSTADVVDNKTGPGALALLDVDVSLQRASTSFVGFVELRIVQEVLLRQGIHTTASTWLRARRLTAQTGGGLSRLAQDALDELVAELVSDLRTANAGSSISPAVALDCLRWRVGGVRPGEDWSAATAIIGRPPQAKWDAVGPRTRISSWSPEGKGEMQESLLLLGLRESEDPWRVSSVTATFKPPVLFEDVVARQRKAWGPPTQCGADVKRFKFESRGCFWQDVWCGTWAFVTEFEDSGAVAVLLASKDLDEKHDEFLKLESAAERKKLPK